MARLIRLKRGKDGKIIEKQQTPAATPAVPPLNYFNPPPCRRKVTAYIFSDIQRYQWVIRMCGEDIRLPMDWSEGKVLANLQMMYPGYDIDLVPQRY